MHKNTRCRKFALQCSNLKSSCNISRLCFRIVYRLEDEFLHFIHFFLWAFSAEKEEWEILLFGMGCIRYNVSKSETGEQVIWHRTCCCPCICLWLEKGLRGTLILNGQRAVHTLQSSLHACKPCAVQSWPLQETLTKKETPPSASC